MYIYQLLIAYERSENWKDPNKIKWTKYVFII